MIFIVAVVDKLFTILKQCGFLAPSITKFVFLMVLIMLHTRKTVTCYLILSHLALYSVLNI